MSSSKDVPCNRRIGRREFENVRFPRVRPRHIEAHRVSCRPGQIVVRSNLTGRLPTERMVSKWRVRIWVSAPGEVNVAVTQMYGIT